MRLLLAIAVLASLGCSADSKGRPKVVPAEGQVLSRGSPVADANVTFLNPEANRTAYARTDSHGRFRLTTFESGDGAVPGLQKVTIHKVEVKNLNPSTDAIATSDVPQIEERWIVPRKFSIPDTSGLTVEVTDGGKNNFTIELKD